MKKIFFLLISVVVFARENPFVPQVKINNPSPIESMKDFSKIAFSFPDNARVLNQVKLIYTSIDGGQKEYVLNINERIDWHDVYMLLNAKELIKKEEKAQKEPVSDEEKIKQALNQDEQKKEENIQANKAPEQNTLEYRLGGDFKINIKDKSIVLVTEEKLLRQFILNKPDRIVLDFKTNQKLKNLNYEINASYVKEVYTGVHSDFYRIVLKLDGKYSYKLVKEKHKYELKLI